MYITVCIIRVFNVTLLHIGMDNRVTVTVRGDLIIDPVMLSDDGGFICEASSIVGEIQTTVYLDVQCK